MRRVWAEQYTGDPGQLRWREVKDMPSPAELIARLGGPVFAYELVRIARRGSMTASFRVGPAFLPSP